MSKGDTFRFSITNYFSNAVNALYRVARNQYNLQHSWTWITAGINWTSAWTSRASRAFWIRISIPTAPGLLADGFREQPGRFLYGKASAFTQISPLYNNLLRNLYGAFVQDNFKVNRRLTLNLGLRWNPFVQFTMFPLTRSHVRPGGYVAGKRSQRFPNLPPGVLAGGDPGSSRAGVHANYHLSIRVSASRWMFLATARPACVQDTDGFTISRWAELQPAAHLAAEFRACGYHRARRASPIPISGCVNPFPVTRPIASSRSFLLPFLLVAFDPNFAYPTIHQWNLTLEQSLPQSWSHASLTRARRAPSVPCCGIQRGRLRSRAPTITNTDRRRPRKEFTQLTFAGTYGLSNYDALVTQPGKALLLRADLSRRV